MTKAILPSSKRWGVTMRKSWVAALVAAFVCAPSAVVLAGSFSDKGTVIAQVIPGFRNPAPTPNGQPAISTNSGGNAAKPQGVTGTDPPFNPPCDPKKSHSHLPKKCDE
jgi:hypothetical protein